jgi:hypothetical protein
MPGCARFSVYSTKFGVTSIFFQIWWIFYLLFGHVVLVKEPLAVTNILGSGTKKILVTAGGSSTNTRDKKH